MNGLSSGMSKCHAKGMFAIVMVAMMMCASLCAIGGTDYSVAETRNGGEPINITSETTVKELEDRFGKGTVDFTYDGGNKTGTLTLKEGADFTCDLGEAEYGAEVVYATGMSLTVILDGCDAKITVKGSQASTLTYDYSITGLRSECSMTIVGNGTLTVDMSGFSGSMAEIIGVAAGTEYDISLGKGAKLVCNGLSGDEPTVKFWKGIDCNGLIIDNAEVDVNAANATDVVTGILTRIGGVTMTSAKMNVKINTAMASNGIDTMGIVTLKEAADLTITLGDVTKEACGITGNIDNTDLNVINSTMAIDGEKIVSAEIPELRATMM